MNPVQHNTARGQLRTGTFSAAGVMLVRVLLATITLAAIGGCMPKQAIAQTFTPAADMDGVENSALVRRFFEIAGGGDLDTLTEVVSPDLVIHTAPPGEGASLETLQQTLATARAGLPDFAFRIDDLIAQGDLVVVRTTISGTHLGEFFGTPPTGRRIETSAIDWWRVRDGKLAENWHVEDILGVMEQLAAAQSGGAMPMPANDGATPLPMAVDTGLAAVDAATLEANLALAERFHDEIFERGDLTVADEILAPGFVWHPDMEPGAEVAAEIATAFRAAFPDLGLTADQVVAEGDRVAILWTLSGTHQGELFDLPATGNRVSNTGIDIFRIEDGQIAELWTVADDLGFLIQLGAFPEFGRGAASTPSG